MIYRTHVPPPPLGSHIECVWFFSGYMPDQPRERILPTSSRFRLQTKSKASREHVMVVVPVLPNFGYKRFVLA